MLVHPSLAKPFVMTTVDVGGECALFGNKGIGEVRGGIGQVIPKQLHSVGLTAWIASEVDHQRPTMFSNVFKSQSDPTLKISPGTPRKRGNVQGGHAFNRRCRFGRFGQSLGISFEQVASVCISPKHHGLSAGDALPSLSGFPLSKTGP